VSVVFVILVSMGQMLPIKSSILELFSDRTSSV
jgi:hypothetical protein